MSNTSTSMHEAWLPAGSLTFITVGKVLAFLDAAGRWDPSLALVMVDALAVAVPGFQLARHARAPLLGGRFEAPAHPSTDSTLLVGAAVFGVGWGLVGFRTGPAIASRLRQAGVVELHCGDAREGVALRRPRGRRAPGPEPSVGPN